MLELICKHDWFAYQFLGLQTIRRFANKATNLKTKLPPGLIPIKARWFIWGVRGGRFSCGVDGLLGPLGMRMLEVPAILPNRKTEKKEKECL